MTGFTAMAGALLAGAATVLALPAAVAATPSAPPAASAVAALDAQLARCTAPGTDRAADRACALALARKAELEHEAGRNDAALAALARADAFTPDDLRYAMARAALSLRLAKRLDADGVTAAARAAPEDVGLALMHAEVAAAHKDYATAAADAGRALARRPDAVLALEVRATANVAREDFAAARGDVDHALALEPRSATALRLRGLLRSNAGDYDGALADYELARTIAPRPDDPFTLGSTQFLARRWAESAATLAHPAPAAPEGLYWRIWRYLAVARLAGVEAANGSLGPGTPPGPGLPWPAPVIDYYRGSIGADRLLADAKAVEAADHQSQVCEAHFYMAEDSLLRHRRDAFDLMRQAWQECPRNFHEFEGAQAELRAAGAVPATATATAAAAPASAAAPAASPGSPASAASAPAAASAASATSAASAASAVD